MIFILELTEISIRLSETYRSESQNAITLPKAGIIYIDFMQSEMKDSRSEPIRSEVTSTGSHI